MSDYDSDVEPLQDKWEPMWKDCPHCNGDDVVREPRNSDVWHCSQCARQFEYDELAWE